MPDSNYSRTASEQLDKLEIEASDALWDAICDTVALILDDPGTAQRRSIAITTDVGIRLVLPVIGHPPMKVFWSTDGPRIEAIFPYTVE